MKEKEKRKMLKRGLSTLVIMLAALINVGSSRTSAMGLVTQVRERCSSCVSGQLDHPLSTDEVGDELRERFTQTYPISATGRVSLENVNGSVHITAWDRNEVKVDAVKRGYRRERLNEAKIEVDATEDSVRIRTRYPDEDQTNNEDEPGRYNNAATVDYTVTVPRQARLESIELVNGSLDIDGIEGDVKASSVNGRLMARGLMGEAKLSTVNGNLEATFNKLDGSKQISLGSVNGNVVLVIPSDSNAQVKASTVHGGIVNDFGLPVQHGEYVGHELFGQLGIGGPRVKLGSVNGGIVIKHAVDGRALSSATCLLPEKSKDKTQKGLDDETRQLSQEARRIAEDVKKEVLTQIDTAKITREAQIEAQREAEQAIREAQREILQAQREIQRDTQRQLREQARAKREGRAAVSGKGRKEGIARRLTERESKSFSISGRPSVSVVTFDGGITVHGWDKSAVTYTATKQADDEQRLRQVSIQASQQGPAISIIAKCDGSDGSAYLDVYVPRDSTLHISSDDGQLSVEGVSGEITLRSGDGEVEVTDGRGQLQVNTGDGQIRIANFEGQVDARTGDGPISLDGKFTALSAQTGDGTIDLSVPPDSNFTVETDADSMTNEGLTVSEDLAPSKRVKRWKVGRGGNVFSLHTGDGNIVLRPR
jgi:DUF4097 and DUF4098 domain-containing protein YvlB